MRGVLKKRDGFDTADIAAVWPASAQIAPLPVLEIEHRREQVRASQEIADKAQPDLSRFIGAGALVMAIMVAFLL